LKKEGERHIREGLSEDELEIFDLLKKEKMTEAEKKQVRLAAHALLKRLLESTPRVLVQDWFKDKATQMRVRDAIEAVLDKCLPEDAYDRRLFIEKRDQVFDLVLDHAVHHRKWAA